MSQELLYTSAPRGLKPGSRGFCTVLCTQGMSAPLASAVEGLSAYRPIYPAADERASRNPVVYSHLKLQTAGRSWHVLSRIADFGLDYSQRANKLAHHVILDQSSEKLPSGPANLLLMPGFMREDWDGEPKVVGQKPVTREPQSVGGLCRHWKDMTGDAGWAGVIAESFLRDPDRLVILLFEPGQEILPLFAEVLSLLPPEKRWEATFSTYFTGLATGTTCQWRAMLRDSKESRESLRFVNALRIDLASEKLETPEGGELVEAARSGHPVKFAAAASELRSNALANGGSEASVEDTQQSLPTRRRPSTNGSLPPMPRYAGSSVEQLERPSKRGIVALVGIASVALVGLIVGVLYYTMSTKEMPTKERAATLAGISSEKKIDEASNSDSKTQGMPSADHARPGDSSGNDKALPKDENHNRADTSANEVASFNVDKKNSPDVESVYLKVPTPEADRSFSDDKTKDPLLNFESQSRPPQVVLLKPDWMMTSLVAVKSTGPAIVVQQFVEDAADVKDHGLTESIKLAVFKLQRIRSQPVSGLI